MSNFGHGGFGFSLKALLEDPNLQNPPNLQTGVADIKKPGKHGSLMPNHNSAFLGPNLWEKPGNNGSEFDLEYMDLDEFLSENGIPTNLDEADEAQTMSLLATALTQSPPRSPNTQRSPGIPITPPSPRQNALTSQERDKPGDRLGIDVFLPESPIQGRNISPINLSPLPISNPQTPEPSMIEKCLLDDNFGIKFNLSDLETKTTDTPTAISNNNNKERKESSRKRPASDKNFAVSEEDLSLATIPVYSRNCPGINVTDYCGSPSVTWSENSPQSCVDDEESLMNNSVPGQENFDPANRKFSEEELKPQPIIKKSKKVFVDDSAKDDRYWQRRKKNNIAAKRSRDARRVKENQIAMRASFLEQQNDELREQMEELKKENEELIKRLSKYEKV